MKNLLSFRFYESQTTSGLTPELKGFLNQSTEGTWSVNPTTGLVDVQGDFDCSGKGLKSLSGISFGHVSGNFYCSYNQLTSLEGAPQTVDGNFYCSQNRLTSLAGAPQTVCGNFHCDSNQLTSLEGAPQTVNGYFSCQRNQLTSLEGVPRTVGGRFDCEDNQLTSLAGAPRKVGGNFKCYTNRLTSLEGAPQTVDGYFTCDEFKLDQGKWNMEGWLKVRNTGTAAARKLILTLPWINPDWWNSELQRDPGKTVHLLAPWWKDMPENMKSKIKIPSGYENEFNLFSEFDELGLF